MSKYTTELRYICEEAAGLNESVGYLDVPEVINNSRPRIFDFDYPIFDNSYKSVLETKIIRHFYTREIAFETVGLWKLKLWTKLNEIMPYYNKLYNSELLEFNPFYDVDLTTDHVRNNEGENHKDGEGARDMTTTPNTTDTQTNNTKDKQTLATQDRMTNNLSDATTVSSTSETVDSNESAGDKTGSGNDVKWDYYSDTPQGNIYDFPGELHDNNTDQMTYLTNARKNTEAYNNTEHVENESSGDSTTTNEGTSTTLKTGTQTTDKTGSVTMDKTGTITMSKTGNVKVDDDNTYSEDGTFNSTEDYLQHVKGKSGGASYSKLLEEYRKTFLNIDMMVIKDLEPLFLHLW